MSIVLRVRDVMDKNAVSIDAGATVADSIKEMLKENVWSLLVEKNRLPEGVVTERDVIRRCIGKGLSSLSAQL
jgi:predicted transcriptional regulator